MENKVRFELNGVEATEAEVRETYNRHFSPLGIPDFARDQIDRMIRQVKTGYHAASIFAAGVKISVMAGI